MVGLGIGFSKVLKRSLVSRISKYYYGNPIKIKKITEACIENSYYLRIVIKSPPPLTLRDATTNTTTTSPFCIRTGYTKE
jgi:hypothetical protein